jgi:transketolase
VIRPADANETAHAWRVALERGGGPVAILLSRQELPVLAPEAVAAGVAHGGYALSEAASGKPDVVLVATGSEVSVALEAKALLSRERIDARVVSMPSWELFEGQEAGYRKGVLPDDVPKVSVEAGVAQGWSRWVHASVSIERFGASAPGPEVMARLGITPERVATVARETIGEPTFAPAHSPRPGPFVHSQP